jgi:prevent-host-death family protein
MVSIRELAQQASRIISGVETSGKPVPITRRGRIVAVVMPVDEAALVEHLRERAPAWARKRLDAVAEASSERAALAQELLEAEDSGQVGEVGDAPATS